MGKVDYDDDFEDYFDTDDYLNIKVSHNMI